MVIELRQQNYSRLVSFGDTCLNFSLFRSLILLSIPNKDIHPMSSELFGNFIWML